MLNEGSQRELMLYLKDIYRVESFVETGTCFGDTAVWASSNFGNVITIELSKEIYDKTVQKYRNIKNIDFIFGDTRAELPGVISKLTQPTIFWLDSHWSVGITYGENDECPLIEEINIINSSEYTHFLFIDDARLFSSPPPLPHDINQWPTIDEVIRTLNSGEHEYYIVIINDVIVAVPEQARELVANYCQEVNTKRLVESGRHLKGFALREGYRLITRGIKMIVNTLVRALWH